MRVLSKIREIVESIPAPSFERQGKSTNQKSSVVDRLAESEGVALISDRASRAINTKAEEFGLIRSVPPDSKPPTCAPK